MTQSRTHIPLNEGDTFLQKSRSNQKYPATRRYNPEHLPPQYKKRFAIKSAMSFTSSGLSGNIAVNTGRIFRSSTLSFSRLLLKVSCYGRSHWSGQCGEHAHSVLFLCLRHALSHTHKHTHTTSDAKVSTEYCTVTVFQQTNYTNYVLHKVIIIGEVSYKLSVFNGERK
jgi:hypothetical protein